MIPLVNASEPNFSNPQQCQLNFPQSTRPAGTMEGSADDPECERLLAKGFDRDEDDSLHTKSNAAQLLLGYGDTVDWAFVQGSEMGDC
jgi:hypothetical protein